ncbi:MAG: DUF559 domain-containing protein [Acidimicrobiales bacterium]
MLLRSVLRLPLRRFLTSEFLMPSPDQRLAPIAARQFSCFSRSQAETSGFSNYQVRHRVEVGRWIARHDGAFQLAGTPTTPHSDIAAAVLALPDAHVAGGAAAFMWDGESPTSNAPTIVRPHGRSRHLEGVRVRQTRSLPSHHVTRLGALPITTRARTAFDLAADLSVARLGRFMDDQVLRGKLHLGQVERVFFDLARPGRAGTRTMAEVLDRRTGAPPTESELEQRFVLLCRRKRIPIGILQLPAPWDRERASNERVDVGYPLHRVIVELDGRRYHAQLDAFHRDRVRDQLATAAGWRTLRFSWWQITREPAFVAGILTTVLALER